MATPRKNWSRLFDQVLRMGWPDAVLADFVRLQAFMNGRWARDGLTPEEANEAVLSPQECMVVTATQNPRSARRRLLALPTSTPMGEFEVQEVRTGRDRRVHIRWGKFAEFQEYRDRSDPDPGKSQGRSTPEYVLSETRGDETKRNGGERGLETVGAILAGGSQPSPAPSDLSQEEKRKLGHWVRDRHPYYASTPRCRELVDACLTHHRDKGTRAADWVAECRRWIDREARFERKQR